MAELITKAEFARKIGKSRQYIQKLVTSGKLIIHNKKLDYNEGMAALKSTARPANELGEKFNKEQKGKGAKKAALERAAGKADIKPGKENRVDEIDPEIIGTSKAMQKARLLKEINLAKIQEAEYKKTIGELLPVDIVRKENSKIAEVVRAKLLSLPSRAAPRLLGLKTIPEIQNLLQEIVNEILQEFVDMAKIVQENY